MVDLRKIKIYQQERSGACGPAAMRSILSYFGVEKSENELIKFCKTNQSGTEPEMMAEVFQKLGFVTKTGSNGDEKTSWQNLNYWINKRKIPVIVDWFSATESGWDGHYSVALNLTKDYVIIGDPEFKEAKKRIRKIAWKNFLRAWIDWRGNYAKKSKDVILRWWLAAYKK